MINKFLLIIFFTFVLSEFLYSQSIMGLSGGYHCSNYFDNNQTGPHYSGSSQSYGAYCISGFIKQRNHKVNLGSAVSFVNRKLQFDGYSGGLAGGVSQHCLYNLNYLYFSIFPEFSSGKKTVFNISFGPQFGFLMHSHVNGYAIDGSKKTNKKGKTSEVSAADLRLFASFNLEIPINEKIKIDITNSYSLGLFNAFDEGAPADGSVKCSDLSLTAGIIYKLEHFTFSLLPKAKDHSVK